MSVSPSSVLPIITEWSEGGIDYPKSYALLHGSGRFTGNFADPRQERDFIDPNKGDPISGINFGTELAGFDGKGINKYYPSPKEYSYGTADGSTAPSGVFISYPPSSSNPAYWIDSSRGTGIFNFKEFISDFSNAKESKDATLGINNFTIFNPYIHYFQYEECGEDEDEDTTTTPIPGMSPAEPEECAIKIPFVADLIPISSVFDRYKDLTPEEPEEDD